MARVIRCDCGFQSSGGDDDTLVCKAQAHARDVHGNELAADVVRALIQTAHSEGPPKEGRDRG